MEVDVKELKRKSVAGVVSYGVRSALLYVIAIGATALLSAFLSPSDFGVYFVVTAVIGVFTFLSDIGLAAALVQKKTEPTLTELRTSFTVQQILAGLILAIIIVLTPVWKSQSNLNTEGLALLYALGFSFILASFKTIPSILLERKLKFQTIVIPQMIEQLVFYSLAVILAYKGMGITSFTVAVILRSIAGVITIYVLQPWKIGLAVSKKALKVLLHFGVKFQANDLLARLKDDMFVVVLGKFLPLTQMGYLGWAKRWSMFPYQFSVQNVIAITFPTFSRMQHDKKLIARGLELSIYFISLIILPVLFGMSVLAKPLTEVVEAYTKWQPAIPALYFFCLNIGLAAIANPFINALNAMGKINQTLKLMVVMTLVTWGLSPVGWYLYGFVGIAVVAAVVAAISLVSIAMLTKLVRVRVWSNLWVPLISSGFMALVLCMVIRWLTLSLVALIVQVLIGMVVYVVCVLILDKTHLFKQLKYILPKWF